MKCAIRVNLRLPLLNVGVDVCVGGSGGAGVAAAAAAAAIAAANTQCCCWLLGCCSDTAIALTRQQRQQRRYLYNNTDINKYYNIVREKSCDNTSEPNTRVANGPFSCCQSVELVIPELKVKNRAVTSSDGCQQKLDNGYQYQYQYQATGQNETNKLNDRQKERPMKASTSTSTSASKEMERYLEAVRVVVIGAGASGIAAATRLIENGCRNVTILEAENRLGGRVYTIPFADNVVDLGAQWCHGERNNVVYEKVKDSDMLESTGSVYEEYQCVRSNGEVVSKDILKELKKIIVRSLHDRQCGLIGYEGSLGSYLTDLYWKELESLPNIDRKIAKEFFENFKKFESSVEASDHLHEVSGKGHLEYWICDGDLLLNWKDQGYRSFLKVLMGDTDRSGTPQELGLLNGRLVLNRRVELIDWSNPNDILVRCCGGDFIRADHVICTVSLGVLKENHLTMFCPPLPRPNVRAIEGLKLGTVNKFFLEFEDIFGPSDWKSVCFLWREEDLLDLRNSEKFWLENVFGFYRVAYQPRVIEGWIVGPHGRHMEKLPEKDVIDGLQWLFGKFLQFPLPQLKSFVRTKWHSNPNFRGSYTFRSMYTDELRTGASELSMPLLGKYGKPLVMFAGEATHPHYYSTVHGAVESGWREADRVMSFYSNRASHL